MEKLKNRLVLFLLVTSYTNQARSQSNACVAHEQILHQSSFDACQMKFKLNKCDVYLEKLTQSKGQDFANSQIATCGSADFPLSKDSATSCSLMAAMALSQLSKSVLVRTANFALGAAFTTMVLKNGIEADKKCYEDKKSKKDLVEGYLGKIESLEAQFSLKLEDLKPNRFMGIGSEQRINEVPCNELRNYLLEKTRATKMKLLDLTEVLFPEPGLFEELQQKMEVEAAGEGIHFRCLKTSVQAEMICDVLALSTSLVGIGKSLLSSKKFSGLKVSEVDFIKEAVKSVTPRRFRTELPKDMTYPSRVGDNSNLVEGTTATRPKNNKQYERALDLEDHASQALASSGYKVKVNKNDPTQRRSPDLEVEGQVFDIYAPQSTTTINRIFAHTISKTRTGQTQRVVVDLSDSPHAVNDIRINFLLQRPDFQGVKEVLAVTKTGEVIRLFP